MAQSELHRELSERALVWLDGKATNRGIRGCVEMIIQEGYVVDSGAVTGLTMNNEKLFTGEYKNKTKESADDYTFVFESKVSRADFQNTFIRSGHKGNRLEPVANFHFIVTPKKLLSPDEVPAFWGLLEQSGQGLAIRKMPEFQSHTNERLYEFAYLLMRSIRYSKFHFDWYERQKEEYEIQQKETDATS